MMGRLQEYLIRSPQWVKGLVFGASMGALGALGTAARTGDPLMSITLFALATMSGCIFWLVRAAVIARRDLS